MSHRAQPTPPQLRKAARARLERLATEMGVPLLSRGNPRRRDTRDGLRRLMRLHAQLDALQRGKGST